MINPNNPDYTNTPVSPKRPKFDYRLRDNNVPPLVSIVTPFYNTGEIFYETAQSIFNQSFQQWEWLIINDGSSNPEALRILDEFRSIDPRVKVIDHPENFGLSAARNTGYKRCSTKYIIYLDSDDLIEPKTIELYYWFLETNMNVCFVNSFSVGFGEKNYLWARGFFDNEKNLQENFIDNTALIRKSIIEKLGGFDESIKFGAEDWDFWIKAANEGYWGVTIPEYLKWYRTRVDHSDRWLNLKIENIEKIKVNFNLKYMNAFKEFPVIKKLQRQHFTPVNLDISNVNLLEKKNKNVLLILPYLVVGGADRYIFDLVSLLVEEGWNVSIVTTVPSENTFYAKFCELTCDIFILPNFLGIHEFPKFISYLINSRDFDLVMVQNSLIGYLILPFLKYNFPNVRFIDLTHTVTTEWLCGGYPRLSVLYQGFLDTHITISHQIRDWMVGSGVAPEKIKVLHWGIDTTLWKQDPEVRARLRKELGIDEDIPIIVYNARLVEGKQPDIFFNVILSLSKKGLIFKTIVIGDGPFYKWLEESILKASLSKRILLLGQLELDQVRNWLSIGDIIFLPSRQEGIPLVFFEGMAMQLVPVGANLGGTEELVSSDCGILIDRSSLSSEEEVAVYVAALEKLILNKDLLLRMKRNCLDKIERRFSKTSMREALLEIIKFVETTPKSKPTPDDYYQILQQVSIDYFQLQSEANEIWSAKETLRNELMRITQESQEVAQKNFWMMPPVSASTYLYFAVRALVYPLYKKLPFSFQTHISKLKNGIKNLLVAEKRNGEVM